MKSAGQRWNYFWFEAVSADNLGLLRILLFGSMFLFYVLTPVLFPSWGWHEDFTLWGKASPVFWSPVWLIAKLHLPPLSTNALIATQLVWRAALALSCVGLFTRFSTAVSFLLGAYLMGIPNSFGKTHHLDQILVWAFMVMAFSRCGDAWSMDALIRKTRARTASEEEDPPPSGEYTWPVHLIWVISAMVYCESGISKLRHSGIAWVTTDTMRWFLMQAYYRVSDTDPLTSWGLALARSRWLSSALGGAALLFELGFPIALFSRKARWVFVPGVMAMQIGIALVLGPNFYQMILCQGMLWVPWDQVVKRLTTRYGSRKTYGLIFDGACGLCQRTIIVVRSLDLLHRVEFLDAANQWPPIEKRFPGLDRERCLAEMHVCTPRGQIRTGFYAYRALAWVLPLGWLVLPILYLPGAAWAGSHVYSMVASRRHRGACAMPRLAPLAEPSLPNAAKTPYTR
jgi:predicted DCC family thiol-disulfide oxidoreductase YuxK